PNSGVLIIDRVGDIDRAGDSIKASGPIEMDYRGYKIFADQMEGNLNSQVFVFNGHVQVIGAQGQVAGSSVTAFFKTKFFRAVKSNSVVKAS
ncbi:hypothetical protein ABTN13_20005, partial [Acinetobacter baumannii]